MPALHHRDGHHGWDRDLPALAQLSSGETCTLVLADCFGGQLGPDAGPAEVAALDLALANPLTGPVEVRDAEPGDAIAIEILTIDPGPVGWTTLLPGFGLLADDFPAPYAIVSRIDGSGVDFGGLARLPRRPFLGTVGLAPAAPGPHSVIPPRRVGGNLDCRDVVAGATLVLPVEVSGGWLSAGDPHATQGDGEVCGTAVETTATAEMRIHLRKGQAPPAPQLELPGGAAPAHGPRVVTTGVGPDLEMAARDATRALIERLGRDHGLAPEDAYALCSVAANLRIVEVVDAPNWVVAADLDLSVLTP
jgi:acetamidase/formamidase